MTDLVIEGLSKSFGGVTAINDVSLRFDSGSLNAVIGPNGAGKTTLFNLITGDIKPDTGRILVDGKNIAGMNRLGIVRRGIGRAFQVASIFPTFTVKESLAAAVLSHRHQFARLRQRFPTPSCAARADQLMEMLGLSECTMALSSGLSHGDQKLLDIGLALAAEPRILLLDEPTAGMGPEERKKMISRVYELWQSQGMTLIFIEHDMEIVFNIAQSIRVFHYGSVLAEGTAEDIRNNAEVIDAYLGQAPAEEATT
jgi:branched-chain amino acid transport system ATP-binding protein